MTKENEDNMENFSSTKNLIISELYHKKQLIDSLCTIFGNFCISKQIRYLCLGFIHND